MSSRNKVSSLMIATRARRGGCAIPSPTYHFATPIGRRLHAVDVWIREATLLTWGADVRGLLRRVFEMAGACARTARAATPGHLPAWLLSGAAPRRPPTRPPVSPLRSAHRLLRYPPAPQRDPVTHARLAPRRLTCRRNRVHPPHPPFHPYQCHLSASACPCPRSCRRS